MTLCSIGVVARRYGVSASTIRRWAAKGLVKIALRTLGGHRRFELDAETPAGASGERKHIGYARVSSHDPKADLQRQAQRLKASGCEEVITDIGSGLNCSKPGLRRLLNCILQGKIHTLSVVMRTGCCGLAPPLFGGCAAKCTRKSACLTPGLRKRSKRNLQRT